MFRTRKIAEQIPIKKYIFFNGNESSTDECSNRKNSLYQINKKQSPKTEILRNRTNIHDISSKRKNDLNSDSFIKEIINIDDDNISKKKETFINFIKSERQDNIDLNTRKKKIFNTSLIPKNHFTEDNKKKDSFIENFSKENMMKRNKKKYLNNLNKYKFKDNKYIKEFFTPKNTDRDLKKLLLKAQVYAKSSEKNKRKNFSFSKNIINYKNEPRHKKLEKILQIINDIKTPSININLFKNKNKYDSLISNEIFEEHKNKRSHTLQNNFKFDIICRKTSKKRKKLILKFNNYNKQKSYFKNRLKEYNDNEMLKSNDYDSIERNNKYRSLNKEICYRKNKTENTFFDLCTNFNIEAKTKRNNIIRIGTKQKNFDSSLKCKNHNTSKKINEIQKDRKINEQNYKLKLNNIQKRMSSLIGKLVNYIEILKEEK